MSQSLESLQKLARDGDTRSERELFDRLAARFRLFARQRVGSRDDAEDVVQDALKTIFEKYRSTDFETSFSGWAYRVLTNKILTYGRAARVRHVSHKRIKDERNSEAEMHEMNLLETQLIDCLRKLHAVHRRHARILNLSYQGFNVNEIRERMGLTRTNLYTLLSRARSLLQACLERGEVK